MMFYSGLEFVRLYSRSRPAHTLLAEATLPVSLAEDSRDIPMSLHSYFPVCAKQSSLNAFHVLVRSPSRYKI